jgi:DNA-binding NtrC family response regulator
MARILLVEDDPDVRVAFEHILLDAGHEVDTAQTVSGGDELLSCRDYDLLVTDGRLPDGTGMTLADQAKERDIPTLIVTAYAFNLRGEAGVDLSRYNVLLKPMRPSELVDEVVRILSGPESDLT